jgi:coenzyme PQQ precursor peptide PqqA
MPWTKPDFVEITLNMEVTAYVNTDDRPGARGQESGVREERDQDSPTADQ